MLSPASCMTLAASAAPARPPTRPVSTLLSNSSRYATSISRPPGLLIAFRTQSYAMWRGWLSWWIAPRLRPTTGA